MEELAHNDEVAKDGYWKIESRSRRGDDGLAIDKALYRAAELARAAGHNYVEMHDPYSRRNGAGDEGDTLFAHGIGVPVHPVNCRSGKAKRCYTADASVVISRLSGASGHEPGVAALSHVDEYGRAVFQSGFGTGAVGR